MVEIAMYYDFFKIAVDEYRSIIIECEDKKETLDFINKAIVALQTGHAPLKQLTEFTPELAQELLVISKKKHDLEREKTLLYQQAMLKQRVELRKPREQMEKGDDLSDWVTQSQSIRCHVDANCEKTKSLLVDMKRTTDPNTLSGLSKQLSECHEIGQKLKNQSNELQNKVQKLCNQLRNSDTMKMAAQRVEQYTGIDLTSPLEKIIEKKVKENETGKAKDTLQEIKEAENMFNNFLTSPKTPNTSLENLWDCEDCVELK